MLNTMLNVTKDKNRGYWPERIIAQIQYADRLSKVNQQKYDALVDAACQIVIDGVENDGVITKSTAQKAEAALTELSAAAKSVNMICAAHAHIDMNWMWGWDETVSITLETFRTMLDLMNEYPEYTFSQSQASVYKIVEDQDPDMLDEIRARVKEGRWEVTASTWTEPDKNLPNGESQARHILYTKEYLSRLLDIDPDSLNIDFEPDTFGHNANVPEILNKGKVKYYYHCRGYEGHNLYRWVSPSGASVLVYREPIWYNGHIEPSMALYAPEFCSKNGVDTMLKVYGVGDHGGGPTRRDIERIIDMNTWPVFPVIKFGTFGEYFRVMEGVADKLPVVEGELNFVFDGCYTSQSRIKRGNRKSENGLFEAELFSSIASVYKGARYPAKEFTGAWERVLFNHFHDIIPGSGVTDTREYAMGLYQEVLATVNAKRTMAFREIAKNIDTSKLVPGDQKIDDSVSEGAGVGFGIGDYQISQTSRGAGLTRIFHFFNPSDHERDEILKVVVWDWNGDRSKLVIKDDQGVPTEHHVLDWGRNHYWGHDFMNLLVKVKVPALGYSSYVLSEDLSKPMALRFPGDPRVQKPGQYTLENDKVKVTFDSKNASIKSFVDKATGEELVDASRGGGFLRFIEEDGHGGSAWVVGRYINVENLSKDIRINWVHGNASTLKSALSYQIPYRSSKIDVTVELDKNSSLLNFDVRCDWREAGEVNKVIPQLGFYLPLSYNCSGYKYDIPFGVIVRPGMDLDVPANSWALGLRQEAEAGKKSIMLVTESKYGFRCNDDSMSVTLIRSTANPDPYPEYSNHHFSFVVGSVESSSANKKLIDIAHDYNHPLSVLSGRSHGGNEAPSKGYIGSEGNIALSAVKLPEMMTDALIVRYYETEGKQSPAVVRFAKAPKTARFVDINEEKIESTGMVTVNGDSISFTAGPSTVGTILVTF